MAANEHQPPQKRQKTAEPRPSASVVLLSPTNQVLLLHRVRTPSSFPSAHVFPGSNLSDFHDGEIPGAGDARRHEDSLQYRLAAIRGTFMESGILLARDVRKKHGALLNLPASVRDEARRAIHQNEDRFVNWVESVGGAVDTGNLLPFTRWITPEATPKRFTTQMYLYMLPLPPPSPSPRSSSSSGSRSKEYNPVVAPEASWSEAPIPPTPDGGGAERVTARFDDAASWLARQRRGEIMLFPPQCFLLHLVSRFLTGPAPPGVEEVLLEHYREQREQLLDFLETVPTSEGARHPTAHVPWQRKIISPALLGVRRGDGRAILGLDKPGPELDGTGHGGDWERVVLVKFGYGAVRNVEVRDREEVLAEEQEADLHVAGFKSKL